MRYGTKADEKFVTMLVVILGRVTAVMYLGKGYFEWDTARLKNEIQKRRKGEEKEV